MRHHEDQDDESLLEKVETLQKALDAGQYNAQAPALQVEDLSTTANRYLSRSARYDLANKALTQIVKYDDGRTYPCLYLAVTCKTGNEEKGVKAIANVLNDLSAKGLIHSCLAPVSSIHLARVSLVQKSVVFCFVHVPESHYNDCKVLYKGVQVEEGGIGDDVEDLSPELAEGDFYAEIRISHLAALKGNDFDSYRALQNEIDVYLGILPKGTQVKSVIQLAVIDLSLPYCVIFHNPLLQKVKSVELDYVRDIAVFGEKVEQFNLTLGVRYLDKDGKNLHSR